MFDQTKKAAVSTFALATMLALTPAFAQDDEQPPTSDTNAAVSEPVQDEATAKVDEKRKTLLKDATNALDKTKEALKALDDGDSDAALEALAVATGKLQSVVARDPELALAPVDVQLLSVRRLRPGAKARVEQAPVSSFVDRPRRSHRPGSCCAFAPLPSRAQNAAMIACLTFS